MHHSASVYWPLPMIFLPADALMLLFPSFGWQFCSFSTLPILSQSLLAWYFFFKFMDYLTVVSLYIWSHFTPFAVRILPASIFWKFGSKVPQCGLLWIHLFEVFWVSWVWRSASFTTFYYSTNVSRFMLSHSCLD